MKTIALRFGEHFAPECGTIAAHQKVIDRLGFTWYGKFGSKVSEKYINELLQSNDPKILLINSGKAGRYWAHICECINDVIPDKNEYPEYYAEKAMRMHCWFKITLIEPAPKDIMSKCFVTSSGLPLGEVSRQSMSPYFKISYEEE